MVVSGIRCTLTYVIFPWVLPAIGIAGGFGAGVGLSLGAIAIAFNIWSIWRFWRADHRYKWAVTIINSGVMVLLLIMATIDINNLVS